MLVNLNEIKVENGRRSINQEKVKELSESIKELGLINAITITKGNVLIAGNHRLEAFKLLGRNEIECNVVDLEGLKAELAEIDENLIRNELHPIDRGEQLLKRKEIYEKLFPESTRIEKVKQNLKQNIDNADSAPSVKTFSDDTSKKVNISQRVIQEEMQMAKNIIPEAKKIIKEKDVNKTDALKIARMEPEQQKKVAEALESREDIKFNQAVRKVREEEQKETLKNKELPEGKYDVIYADPPWRYEFSETESRAIENQYPSMELEEIKNLKIPTSEEAILLLWATAPKLEEALEVLKSWGFIYKTCAVWDKEIIGMGYWFRGQHELLLVGIKGKFNTPLPENRFSSVFKEKRTKHSKKPNEYYEMIEKMFPNGKYLELFARNKHNEKWTVWGNQA